MKLMLTIFVFPLIAAIGLGFGASYSSNSSAIPSVINLTVKNPASSPIIDTLTIKDLDFQNVMDQFDSDYVLIKITNSQNEVISKWQGKTDIVLTKAIVFLKKASEGSYIVCGILKDGTKKFFVFDK